MNKPVTAAVIFLSLFSVNLLSQGFTFTRISPEYVIGDTSSFEIVSYAKLTTNSSLSIRIIRTIENLTPSWDSLGSAICNYQNCFGSEVDTIPPAPYAPGAADDTISVHFYCRSVFPLPNGTFIHGAGYVRLRAELVSNPSQFQVVDFRAVTPQTIGIKQLSTIAKDFSLEQNYPNPFNPSTKIEFAIPNSEYVSLRVYDILGREVKILVNENLTQGEYEVDFKAEGLSSGMYYYSLRSGENVSVKKMVLVK